MRAMQGKENNEKHKHHDSERERTMNVSKGNRRKCWTSNNPGFSMNENSDGTVTTATCMHPCSATPTAMSALF